VVKKLHATQGDQFETFHEVHANVVASMVFLRPSLRKIAAPPDFPLSDRNRKLFSCHGCLLEC